MSKKPELEEIDFSHRSSIGDYDGEECLTYFKGIGKTVNGKDKQVECGRIKGCYVNLEKADTHVFDVLDMFNADVSGFVSFFDGNFYEKELVKQFKTSFDDDDLEQCAYQFLIILNIDIPPEYRGYGFGEVLLKEAIKSYHRDSQFIFLESFPLQFSPYYKDNPEEKKEQFSKFLKMKDPMAHQSLLKYYRRLGFKTIKGIEKFDKGGQLMARTYNSDDWLWS